MDYADFQGQVYALADQIRADGFAPDVIVGVARGGWIPARLLAGRLGVKKLLSYGVSYTDAARRELAAYQDALPPPEARKVLIVEDYLESGKSILKGLGELTGKGFDARTAALGYLSTSLVVPHYSLGVVNAIPLLPWDEKL